MWEMKKLIIVLGVGIGILLITLFLYFDSVNYTTHEGYEAIAEKKAREVFFWHYFAVGKYNITIYQLKEPLLKNHNIYRAYGNFIIPSVHCVVAVGLENRSFLLPRELSEVLLREGIQVDMPEKALEIARVYINFSKGYTEVDQTGFALNKILILQQASDIPWVPGFGKDPNEFIDTIRPVWVCESEGGYSIDIFTWSTLGGYLEKWLFDISNNCSIKVMVNHISSGVGSYGVLE